MGHIPNIDAISGALFTLLFGIWASIFGNWELELQYTQCTLKLRPVKLLFVIFGRLSYSFLSDLKSNLSVH